MDDFDFGIGASGKIKALLAILLATFMSALAVGIVGAPMEMHPVLGYLLKGFILLVFGGIAAFCVMTAFESARSGSAIPKEALARCLTCGEETPHDLVCPVCAEPPQERSGAFQLQTESIVGASIVATIFAGVGCLGIFILIGPYIDGERRWWALIAFAALGLLMIVVGAIGIFGFVVMVRERFRGATDISFNCKGPERYTYGKGKVAWRKLVWLEGHGQITAPLAAKGRPEGGYRASPGDIALAEMIATFDAAGLVDLGDVITHDWRLGDSTQKKRVEPLAFHRDTQRRIMMILNVRSFMPFDPDGDGDVDAVRVGPDAEPDSIEMAVGRFLSRYLAPALSIREFKTKLDADPIHRTQAEMHARVLRDRGIVPANELVEAIVEGLVQS